MQAIKGNSHIDSKTIKNKVKLPKTKFLKCEHDKSIFLKTFYFIAVNTQKTLAQGQ